MKLIIPDTNNCGVLGDWAKANGRFYKYDTTPQLLVSGIINLIYPSKAFRPLPFHYRPTELSETESSFPSC